MKKIAGTVLLGIMLAIGSFVHAQTANLYGKTYVFERNKHRAYDASGSYRECWYLISDRVDSTKPDGQYHFVCPTRITLGKCPIKTRDGAACSTDARLYARERGEKKEESEELIGQGHWWTADGKVRLMWIITEGVARAPVQAKELNIMAFQNMASVIEMSEFK
jgi:hypothetical protein